jgi:hypothetical protein
MKTRHTIITLAVGATLALASTAQGQVAQGDRSLPTSKAFAVNHSTTKAQKAARLRSQHQAMLTDFWQVHGPGGVAPGGVYTPSARPGP